MIPRQYLEQPFNEQAFSDAAKCFLRVGVPVGIGVGLLFIIGIATYALLWYAGAVFFMLGIGLACVFKLWYDSYQNTVKDLKKKRKKHSEVVTQVLSLINDITVNQNVVVKNGGTFNNAVGGDVVTNNVKDPINEIYDLAHNMMSLGVQAWFDNQGKRPRPKPFSAEAITEQFHVGRDKWTEGVQLLADAKVFSRPHTATWTPQVKNVIEGERALEKYMQEIGYLKNRTQSGDESWMKK